MRRFVLSLAAALLAVQPVAAQQTAAQALDRTQVARIIDIGTNGSEVMRIAQYLTDVIGPRLTNSPGMRHAEAWTQAKFAEWGLVNVHTEGFAFGRGWWVKRASVRMTAPRAIDLAAVPVAWTPGTGGPVSAPVVLAPLRNAGDLAQWRGKLAGKIVLVSEPRDATDPDKPAFRRWTADELAALDVYEAPADDDVAAALASLSFAEQRNAFLKAEGALAFASISPRDGKLLQGAAYQFTLADAPQVPGFEIAAEDYRRLARLLKMGAAPVLEVLSDVGFDDGDATANNVIADIPGSDPRAGYVMAGAHLDSWAAGDGAADNGAGSAMVMEAARIIRASGIKPRRTIRFALWAGEEQGLLGSIDYLERHVANRPGTDTLKGIGKYVGWTKGWPITPLPGHAQLAAYFNLDNGSGKVRGIYAENNFAAVPILREWLAPFAPMGAATVAIQGTTGTDHQFFASVGIPAFQFIQDPLDYGSRLHHTNIDTFDHLKADDMRQGAIILAAFLLQAANAEKPLPRVPFPTEPKPGDGLYAFPGAAPAN